MKILLATDGSADSLNAARLLAQWKHTESLTVDVISVANVSIAQGVGEFDIGPDFTKGIEQQSHRAAETTVEILKQVGIEAKSHVVLGHPAATIVEKASELKSDLVIVGAQGHSMVQRLLLGSVSDFVATHVHCSVLVVRDTSFLSQDRPLRVCIGYDDSEPCKNAIDELSKTGWAKNAVVDLASAIALPIDNFSDLPVQLDPQQLIEAYQQQIEKAAVGVRQKFSGTVNAHVLRGNNVGFILADFAKESGADLMVVGDTGRGMLARFFLGSVSRSVLRHSPCSVFLVRKRS
jgi:nucleotide-binding universal stress UspA family protein